MATVTISCSDPRITKHCVETFGNGWNKHLAQYLAQWDIDTLLAEFRSILTNEARKQEWYQYEDVDGRRQMVLDDTDTPVLLVPEVSIES